MQNDTQVRDERDLSSRAPRERRVREARRRVKLARRANRGLRRTGGKPKAR